MMYRSESRRSCKPSSTIARPSGLFSGCVAVMLFVVLLLLCLGEKSAAFAVPSQSRHLLQHHHRQPFSHHRMMAGGDDQTSLLTDELLQEQDLRKKLKACSIFENLAKPELARLAAVVELLPVENGEVLIKQDDKAGKAMYLVESGEFECFSPSEGGDVKKVCQAGDYFGEISMLFKQPRALSVRAITDDASVWKITERDFALAVSSQEGLLKRAVQDDPNYEAFFEGRDKLKFLKKCPLFRKMSSDDLERITDSMERVEVERMGQIITQGEEGDSMYFVMNGAFDCYDEQSGKVMKTCKEGDYFGELSLVLSRDRALSVRNANDSNGALWRLGQEAFLQAVQSSSVFESAVDLIREEYQIDTATLFLKKLKPKEVYQLCVAFNLPKKKPVSLHSSLATATTGMWIIGLCTMLTLGMHTNMIPLFFDVSQYPFNVVETQFLSLCFAIVGVTGAFRLPPNTPPIRRYYFELTALQTVTVYQVADSNLSSIDGSRWTYDLLSINPGYIFVWFIFLWSTWKGMQLISAAISATEKERKTVPLNGNAVVISLATFLVLFVQSQIPPACFFTLDVDAYNDIFLPYAQPVLQPAVLPLLAMTVGGMGMNMLAATLLFEKKLTNTQSSLFSLVAFYPLYDWLVQVAVDGGYTTPEMLAFTDYSFEVYKKIYIYPILVGLCVVAAMHGFFEKQKRQGGAYKP